MCIVKPIDDVPGECEKGVIFFFLCDTKKKKSITYIKEIGKVPNTTTAIEPTVYAKMKKLKGRMKKSPLAKSF